MSPFGTLSNSYLFPNQSLRTKKRAPATTSQIRAAAAFARNAQFASCAPSSSTSFGSTPAMEGEIPVAMHKRHLVGKGMRNDKTVIWDGGVILPVHRHSARPTSMRDRRHTASRLTVTDRQ
jgi:hypothetical protein